MPLALRYVAAANLLLSEYKLADHMADRADSRCRWRYAKIFYSRSFRAARRDLAALDFPLIECDRILRRQAQLESSCSDVEQVAAPTAEATSMVFRHGARIMGLHANAEDFARAGYHFGALIYVLDAWDDFEQDARTGAFNALQSTGAGRSWAEEYIRERARQLDATLERLALPARPAPGCEPISTCG